jgi:hypothetical protein
VFGIGLPMLSLLLDHDTPLRGPLGQAVGWTVAVLAAPLVAHRYASSLPPEAAGHALADYRAGAARPGDHRPPARRPAVPVKVAVSGDLFRPAPDAVLPLTLDRPVEILLRDGTPTGDLRLPGEPWQLARETRWISIPWIRARLDPTAGPVVESALVVDFHGHPALKPSLTQEHHGDPPHPQHPRRLRADRLRRHSPRRRRDGPPAGRALRRHACRPALHPALPRRRAAAGGDAHPRQPAAEEARGVLTVRTKQDRTYKQWASLDGKTWKPATSWSAATSRSPCPARRTGAIRARCVQNST